MKNAELRDEQIWLGLGSLMIIATVALAFALVYTRDVMVPFVLAILITVVVSPVFDFQVIRWRLPRWIAVITTLLIVLALLALLGYVLLDAIQHMVRSASEYSQQVVELTAKMIAKLNAYHIQVDQARITADLETRLPGVMTQAAGTVTSLLSHGFLIVIFVVFLLIGRNPNQQQQSGIYADVTSTIRRYLTTMTAIATATGVLVGLILGMLGLNMAWLFGLLVFLLMFIPNIGSIVATLLPIPVAVTQFQDPWMVLAVIVFPGAVHVAIGNLIAPRLMGSGLELHPVTVLLALAFWGLLWGIAGMVLAVPIVAILRIVLLRFETTRPLAEILSGRLPGTAAAAH